MNDINFWKRTFLCGASLLLIAASPAMASGVDAMSTEGVAAVQQNGRTVTVTVNDAMGPVIGANVLVKGTTIGSITDMDGNAVIQGVPNGAVIIVSYIGYITQEINLPNGQSALTVELKEDAETLDEVVVVGYGTQAKKDITGSVAVVSRDAITEQPVATFAEALQGRASSVYINNAGGPAGDTTIRIRGVGSANGSDPLIIVDGVQGADISSVNPNDIDTMNVLKDAAATAIYGARAANGVIIITTKQGNKEGKVRVSYSGYISALVYPYWHPSEKYIAFSVNDTKQAFFDHSENILEVFDNASDIMVYDIDRHEIFTSPLLESTDSFETFPTFSPDGKSLYFCSAIKVDSLPNDLQGCSL